MVPRGTIMIELKPLLADPPTTLLELDTGGSDNRLISLQVLPEGFFALVIATGDGLTHGVVEGYRAGQLENLRLTYAWDIDRDWARLAVERPGQIGAEIAWIADPVPLHIEDVARIFSGRANVMAPEIVFCAVSDQVEPIGPMPRLHADTRIATDQGDESIGGLAPGDGILTQAGKSVPVIQCLRRTLPARGSFRPIRLRAPYFGLRYDIVVSSEQALLLRGPDVEYNFGEDAVLVPALHFVSGASADWVGSGPFVQYAQPLLPRHEVILAAGAPVDSLFVGRLRNRQSVLPETAFSDLPIEAMPVHRDMAYPVLQPFEAISLLRSSAA